MPGDLGFCKFENSGKNQMIGIKLTLHSIFRMRWQPRENLRQLVGSGWQAGP